MRRSPRNIKQQLNCDVKSVTPFLCATRSKKDNGRPTPLTDTTIEMSSIDFIADLSANEDDYDEEVRQLIEYPANKQTRTKYQYYENEFMSWCDSKQTKGEGEKDYNRPKQVCNYINHYVKEHPDGKGSVWSIYSALNSFFKRKYEVNLNKNHEL